MSPAPAARPWRPAIDGTRYPCPHCGSTQIASSRGRCSACGSSKPVQPAMTGAQPGCLPASPAFTPVHGPGAAAPAVTPPRAHPRD